MTSQSPLPSTAAASTAHSNRRIVAARYVTTLVMAGGVVSLIAAPRLAPGCLALTLLPLSLWVWASDRRPFPWHVPLSAILAAAYGFWIALSGRWGPNPPDATMIGVVLAACALCTTLITSAMQRLPGHARSAVMFGVVAGFIIGALYVAIELLSDLTIRKSVYAQWPWLRGGYGAPTTMAVADTDINRNALVVALMLWPTLAAGRSIRPEWLRRIAIVSVIVLACTAVSLSSSQSAILTLVVGTLAAALSYSSPRHALRLVAVSWVITVVSVVPLVQGIAALGYQHDMRIPFSVRDRIAIWGHTASLVKQAPLFGAGLYAGRARDETIPATRDPITSIGETTGRHAHNFYLQTWFELGGVGAALLLATGLALLATVRKLTPDIQRAPLTVFAAGAASIATSFGLEQLWLHATLMITACLIILAAPRAGAHEVA